jgi:hypothetical protein
MSNLSSGEMLARFCSSLEKADLEEIIGFEGYVAVDACPICKV